LSEHGYRAIVAFRRSQVKLPPAFQVTAPDDGRAHDPARIREMLASQTMIDDEDDDVPRALPPGMPSPDRAETQRMLSASTIDDVDDDDDDLPTAPPAEVWYATDDGGPMVLVNLEAGAPRLAAVSLMDDGGCVVTELGRPGSPPTLPVRPSPRTHRTVHVDPELDSLLAAHSAFATKVAGDAGLSPSTTRADAVEAKQRMTGSLL